MTDRARVKFARDTRTSSNFLCSPGPRWLCLRETVPDTQIRLKIIRDSRRRH